MDLWQNSVIRFSSFVRSALRIGLRELWYFSQLNRRQNFQNRTKLNNEVQEKASESCSSSPAPKTAVKTRWLRAGLVARLKVSRIGFLQFNKNPKYQSTDQLVWTTTAEKVPRLKTELIWSRTSWGIGWKKVKTRRYPGFRLWSVERGARMLQPEKHHSEETQVLLTFLLFLKLLV